ncbi:geranylgeranylglyceryl phosphate synthase, partial [candidate division MSBL1 archaeon SCGC-AAA261D19]
MSVKKYLDKTIENDGAVHLTLIDPDKQEPETAGEIAKIAATAGTDGIMVGGSSRAKGKILDETANHIKSNVEIPIILFPANELGISKYADAIFFMSLLNSTDPYYITGAQRLGAPKVKKYGLEPIPMGYLIMEPGGAAGRVGKADPIPRKDIASAAHYALAAQYLGMDLVYLESGSG